MGIRAVVYEAEDLKRERRVIGVTTGVCTDSVACIPPRDAEELGVEVVPFPVLFGTRSYRDGVDMEPSEFYSRMAVEAEMPTTSAPSPADYQAACERLAERGCDEVVIITLSGGLSMAAGSARVAATEVPIPVHLVDSRMAAAPQGLLARAAARLAAEGASGREVVEEVERLRPHGGMLAVIPELRYLRRGGRIGRLAGFAGERLGIKPLVTFVDGEVGSAGTVRSLPDAYDRMIKRLLDLGSTARTLEVAVMEAAAEADAARLRERVETEVSPALLDEVAFTPVMGVHTGPGVVGVGWLAWPG